MRPTTSWKDNDGNVVVVFARTPDGYFNGTFTGADAKKLGTKPNVLTDTVVGTDVFVYYNGGVVNDTNNVEFAQDAAGDPVSGVSHGMWVDDKTPISGYEVYIYKMNGTYRIVVREAYVAQITQAANAQGGDIKLKIYEHTIDATVDEDLYLDLAGYAKDAYIAVYAKPGWETDNTDNTQILEVAPLTKESVVIQQIDDNAYGALSVVHSVTGTKYAVNNECLYVTNAAGVIGVPVWGNTNTRTLDVGSVVLYTLNGGILLFDQVAPPTVTTTDGYAYLFDFKDQDPNSNVEWDSEGGKTTTGAKGWVRMLNTSGEIMEVQVDAATLTLLLADTTAPTHWRGELVYYSYNRGTRDYTLTLITGANVTSANTLEVTNKKSEGKIPGYDVAFDSKTVFIVATTDARNQNYLVNNNGRGEVYNIYNVPNFDANSGYVAAALPMVGNTQTNGGAVTTDGQIPAVVLIRDAKSVEAVSTGYYFIMALKDATKVRVLRDPADETNYYEYVVYPAVKDGEYLELKVKVYDTEYGMTYAGGNSANINQTLATGIVNGLSGNEIWFYKDPVIDPKDGCIIALGTNLLTGTVDKNVLRQITAVTKIENDHIKITDAEGGANDNDFLVSTELNSVVFEYDLVKGTITEVKLDTVKGSTTTTPNYHFAIREEDNNALSVLFLNKNATPT